MSTLSTLSPNIKPKDWLKHGSPLLMPQPEPKKPSHKDPKATLRLRQAGKWHYFSRHVILDKIAGNRNAGCLMYEIVFRWDYVPDTEAYAAMGGTPSKKGNRGVVQPGKAGPMPLV
jgi:hypothetical protein